MPRGFAIDKQASIERFGIKGLRNGRWRPEFSFISQPKQISGHGGAHLILSKRDPSYAQQIGEARAAVFRCNREANGGVNRCWRCKVVVNPHPHVDIIIPYTPRGEWDHIRNKPGERCDCPENGRVLCQTCHRKRHPKPQFTRKKEIGK